MEDYESFSDEELCKRAQKGEEISAEILLRRYKNLVVKCSRSYFIIGAETEDLIQEGMIGLYKAILTYRGETKFITYSFQCVKNSILDAIKASTRNKHMALNNYTPLEGESLSSATPEDIAIKAEDIAEKLQRAQENLSKMEKQIFYYYLEGLNMYEIANKIARDVKAVDNAIQRIRKKIKNK